MADFDRNLQPIIKETGYKSSNIPLFAPKDPPMNFSSGQGGGLSDLSQKEDVFAELAAAGQKFSQKGLFVSNAELEANKRYKTFNPTIGDYEDFAAQGQAWYKQATNGVLKGANLAATTVAGGFGMLYGVGKSLLFTQKMSDVYDNEVMRGLDKWNNKVDNEFLPNYYTAAEKNAEWYSTDNWFTTNFLFDKLIKNSGYAVGAMVTGNIANAGLLRAGAAIGGAAAKAATAAEASQAFKLFTPLLRNTSRAFSAGKNIEAASILESQISSIADLSTRSSALANLAKQTTQFAKFGDNARRTAVAINSSAGEASFEALHTSKEFRENLIEEYTKTNGFAPTGEDLKNINVEAERVGKTAFFGNMALLSITEYSQLPYLMGSSYSASRQAANSLLGRVDNFVVDEAGKYAAKAGPKTRFGKIYQGVKRGGAYVFDPKEGAQEVLQYGLQVGTQNYFKKAQEGGEADLYVDGFLYGLFGKDKFGEGVGALVSKEGIESGILGAVTGGLMQARGKYRERKALAKNTESFLNMINNAPSFKEAFEDRLTAANRGVVLQQQERDAIINGDLLEAKDLRNDSLHNYLAPRIKYGRFDMVMEDLGELKAGGMTEQGLTELKEQGMANINDTVQTFQKRITSIENSANALNDFYQALNIRYSGEVIEGTDQRKYPPIVIDYLAYAGSKIANYDVRIPQLNTKLTMAGINTQAILQDIIETGNPNAQATKEALEMINSMDVTSDVKDELKGTLDDVIELSLRRKMFIGEYDGIKNSPLNYIRPDEEIDDVEVSQKEGRKKVQKTLEVGRTYSLVEPITLEKGKIVLAPKFTVLSSTLGGEFEVQLPDGTATFFSPEQFDKYNISEEDNTSQEFEDALNQSIDDVLQYPAFRDVFEKPGEGVNKLEYINSLGDKKISAAVVNRFKRLTKELLEKQAKAREISDKIKESSSSLDKQQEDISDNESFPVGTLPEEAGERVDTGETGLMKSAVDYFDSSTTESEQYNDTSKSQPHVVRSRVFLNNARKFKNRNKLRAIVFTYNQEESLGLSGVTALSFKMTQEQVDSDKAAFETKVTNKENGFVGMVFVELDGKKRYFVDQDGKRIGEVGKPTDLGKVIFQTMPSTSITDSRGNDSYRENEKDTFVRFAQIWRNRREQLMKASTIPPTLEFRISKGIAVRQKDGDVYKKNSVTSNLVDETAIATTPGLINVVTTDTISHNGAIVNSKKGYVYIQSGDLLQYLNNNKLGKKKAATAYELIKSNVAKLEKDASEGKTPQFDKNKILFLKNVLNYKKITKDPKDNQFWFDTENLTLKLGSKSYKFSEIASKEEEIIAQLSEMYHSANAKTLRLQSPFFEYFLEDGKLQEREWPNYQSYLASGKGRTTDEIPFVTIANPTEAQPYAFAGKYATLINFETGDEGYVPSEKEQEPPKPSSSGAPVRPSDIIESDVPVTVGPYTLNDGTVNTVTMFGGEFSFKANILPSGEIEIDAISPETNAETIQKFADAAAKVAIARKKYPTATEGLNDFDAATVFYIGEAASKVEAAINKEEVSTPVPIAPEATVQVEPEKPTLIKRNYVELENVITDFESEIRSLFDSPTVEKYENAIGNLELEISSDLPSEEYRLKLESQLRDVKKSFTLSKETKPEEAPTPVVKKTTPTGEKKGLSGLKSGVEDNETRRARTGEAGGRISGKDIEAFRAWHAKNVPNIPFEILESIITLHDGSKAWGVFENGVAKFFKSGLRGTEYHEVFEGIWKAFLTQSERQAILDEFKAKRGSFLDRESGELIAYSNATDRQAKERIADDFADYRLGKLPARTLSEKVRNFFKAIVDFFKTFVGNPSLKDDLFNSIDTGKFKDYVVSEESKSAAPEYRIMYSADGTVITEDQAWAIVQDMTITMSEYIFNRNNTDGLEKLFNPLATTGKDIYNHLRQRYTESIDILGEKTFQDLFLRSRDLIRTMGINVDFNGAISTNDASQTNRLYAAEAFEIDFQKNMKFSVKFLLASNPAAETIYPEGQAPKLLNSKILPGFKLLNNFNKSFATLLNKLSNTSLGKIDKKIIDLVKEDGNYYRIFNRLGGDAKNGILDYTKFEDADWRFYVQFIQSMSKNNPFVEVAIQRVGENGIESFTAPGDRTSALNKTRNEWFQNIKELSKSETSFIVKVRNDKGVMIYAIDDKNKDYPSKQSLLEPKRVQDYLKNIGIEFPLSFIERINTNEKQKKAFDNAVTKIYEMGPKGYAVLSGDKFSGVDSHVRTLADMYVRLTNPDQDTTRFNIENKRTGNFTDSNAPSVFEAEFNEAMTLDELFESRPELRDAFSTNSLLIKKGGMFFDDNGNKIEGKVLQIGVIDGLKDETTDRGLSISSLTKGDRFTVGINQNINGNYYILIPGDSSIEKVLNLGLMVDYELFNEDGARAFTKIKNAFKGYLEDEIDLALDWETRSKLSATKKNAKELRFFKDILDPSLVDKIHKAIEEGQSRKDILALVSDEALEKSLRNTLTSLNQTTLKDLINAGEVVENSEGYAYETLDSKFAQTNELNRNSLSEDSMMQVLSFVNMNYMIANIEMHKFIFGDPYQFKIKNGKLDETKRIKSWLSPRRVTIDHPEFNKFLNNRYNDITEDISLEAEDLFRYTFKSYVKTITLNDVNPASEFVQKFEGYDESDGFSIMLDGAYREVKLKNGEWSNDLAEPWFQWNQSYARQKLSKIKKDNGDFVYNYDKNTSLEKYDAALIKKPQPPFVTEVMKPIVSGSKFGVNRIEGVLDKFSQMPITYKMVENTNLENLYVQMLQEKVGYVVYKSARKEGAREGHNLYNGNGDYNTAKFGEETIEKVAWKTYGIQVENSYEEGKLQTRVSQLTKNDTMDMFENGKEVEGMKGASALAEEKIKIFKEMHQNAYEEFLNKLGLVDLGGNYDVIDKVKVSRELEYELLRRQVSQNVIDTIRLNENGEFNMPFEASSAYEEIRSVLVSMINKSLISPQMNGKPHVQVPATLWENKKEGRGLLRKTKDGYVRITRKQYDALSEQDKKGVVLSSDALKFYEDEDGKRYMEVMIPNFWRKYFTDKTKFPDDEAIFEYLNKEENQKILFGVGARIPHQAMSSTEVFKVAGFLDASMGSTVVVPSEIVAKAGSDFDIDKLNMYLKSVYIDVNGKVKLVEYKGDKEATMDFYTKVYEGRIQKQLDSISRYDDFRDTVLEIFEVAETIEDPSNVTAESLEALLGEDLYNFYIKHREIISEMEEQALSEGISPADYVGNQMGRLATKFENLSKEKFDSNLKNRYVQKMYKKSLENRYYEILEGLVTLPGNFERLMSPVSDGGLSKVADILDDATNNKESDIKNKLISRSFMTSLRQAFLMGKKWVGIAAVNITGHAIGQKVGLYFDSTLIDRLSDYDRGFLGDLSLSIPHNTTTVDGKEMISLGGLKTADGRNEFISDRLSGYATSFVDVANDPYILKLIQSDLVVGTAMLMERIGAGELTAYFLNQPIIIEHLRNIDRIKSRSLFGKDNLEYTYSKFPSKPDESYDLSNEFEKDADGNVNFEKSKQNLLNLIRENANRPEGTKFSTEFNAKQVAIFNEFLKLAKLAQLNFKFTQAYNYDTTRVTNYEGFKRKMTRTESAIESNIVSSIEKVMDDTFIGEQMRLIRKELMALGAIMKLDSKGIDQYIDDVMEPFYDNEYMSEDDFNYVAKKLKSSFLDFLIQTRSTSIFPDDVKNLFTGENSLASRLLSLKKKYPTSNLLSNLIPVSSLQENGPVTVSLKVKPKDAIDIDMHIGMMRELKELEPEFYNDLVKLSILQGTMDTNLSIAPIVPVEDRAAIIAPVIDVLQPSSELEVFNKEGLFYRNNFFDNDIVPEISPRYKAVDSPYGLQIDYSKTDTFLFSLVNGITPGSGKLISLNNKYSFMNQANKDFVKMRRYQYVRSMTASGPRTIVVDITSGRTISVKDFTKLSNEGTVSKNEMVGYKKVKSGDGVPLTIQRKVKKSLDEFSVFKMVNLYGAGRIVAEYPSLMKPSPLDNNTFKVAEELTDDFIISIFAGEAVPTSSVISDQQSLASEVLNETANVNIQMQPDNIEKIKAGTKTTTTRSESQAKQINIPVGESAIVNFGGQDFEVTNRGQLTIEEAGGKEAMIKSEGVQSEEEFMYQQTKDWVNGKGKLYIYDIAPTEVSTGAKTYSGKITSLKPNQIFVFGSNEGGSQGQAPTHGAGAAKLAKDEFGAVQGQSRGIQGQSYAIVTKKFYDVERSSTSEEITTEIKALYDYARNNPDKEFLVSDYSETNLNGYSGQEMAAMFANAGPIPSNIVFNENFEKLVSTGVEPVVEEEVDAVENKGITKEQLSKPYKGFKNLLWYYFAEKAKEYAPEKYDSIVNAKDYHTAYLIGADRSKAFNEGKSNTPGIQDPNDKVWNRVVLEFNESIKNVPVTPKFTYKGTSIDTDFQLTEGQRQALERLIDFSTDPNSKFITLQGAAGTGKTSIIGYLQKYLKSYKFNFLAPTHAATAELAFATVKTGNKQLPMTVASAISTKYDPATGESTPAINAKLARRLGLSNNIIVLDEVSMLNSKDYEALIQVAPKNNIKVIFMGDVMQIPEVDVRNPEKKLVSKAFSDVGQVVLTEVKRTSSDAILNMLTNVRNNVNDQIPIVPSTNQLEYLPISKFNSKLAEVFQKNPEETVLISYTNKGVQDYNTKIRESLGRYGDLQKGDIVVGYLGYSSKQIEKQNIANSVRYTIQDVQKDGSMYSIVASSKKLKSLQDAGVSDVKEIASTNYAQLSRNDSFDFENLTEEDFKKNNEMLSGMMSKLHEAKQIALRTKSGRDWAKYYDVKDAVSMQLRIVDLGDMYIYNPASGVMEKYVNEQHKNIDKDLVIEKGIDFGHAVTIHKSQGSTVKNVFFDASSLPRGSSSKLMMNGEEVSTEKHSLLYVGISRASEYLGINADNPLNFYYPEGQEAIQEAAPEQKSRIIKVDQFNITLQPDGKMFFDNGKEVTNQTIKNKVDIRKELQDRTLRVSTYNKSEYFVLLDGRILGSGKTNLGKETVTDPKIKEQILDKAVVYKKTC